MPYCELKSIYVEGDIPNKTLLESGVAGRQIALYLCPSDSYSARGPRLDAGDLDGIPIGQTNYKGVTGANWGTDGSQPNLQDIGTKWRNKGTNGSYDGIGNGDGLLWRNDADARIDFRRIRDGASHTFLIGEDLPEENRWCCWPYATGNYGTCAIPLNSTDDDPGWWPNTYSFRSAHPHGVNFCMADASLHFVADDISLEAYRALATREGGEPIGNL
jgi:hypothetical protein